MPNTKDGCREAEKPGLVYSMVCGDCDQIYVGETAGNAKGRAKEHRALPRNGHSKLSAIAEHALGVTPFIHNKVLRVADRTVRKQ